MTTTRYYVPCTVKPGESIGWRVLTHKPDDYRFGSCEGCDAQRGCNAIQELHVIDVASYGDYDNSTAIERSNHRVMARDYGDVLVAISGGHGSESLGYLGDFDDLPSALKDAIGALADYPILDESDESELEMEMEQEGWEDYGRREFRDGYGHRRTDSLVGLCDEIDPTHEHDEDLIADDAVYEIWHQGCDALNVNGGSGFQIEAGGSVHFYTREWIDSFRRADDPRYPRSEWSRSARVVLRDAVTRVARASRTTIKPGADAALDERVKLALVAMSLAFTGEQAPAGLIAQCDSPDATAYHVLADYLRERTPVEIKRPKRAKRAATRREKEVRT